MKNVKGIIDDCGFTSITAITKHMMKNVFRIPYFPFGYVAGWFAGGIANVNFDISDGIKEAADSLYPLLIVHGKDDRFVPCQMSEQIYNACSSSKQLFIVEKAGHAAAHVVDQQGYFDRIQQFIKTNM